MALLKLPQRVKSIRLTENGRKYDIDITDLGLMRELSGLSKAALRTMNGTIWTQEEERKIVSDCHNVIDKAFGKGACAHMAEEIPELGGNAVLLLGVCGQIYDIARNAVSSYINQYRKNDADVADIKALLEALSYAGRVLGPEVTGDARDIL